MLNIGIAAFSLRAKLSKTPPIPAVSVTVCAVETDDTLAVNLALGAFAGNITVAGTVTAALLLARLTARPPAGAAPVRLTVQGSDSAPVIEALVHDTLPTESAATLAADMLTSTMPCEELLKIVSSPVKLLALLGEPK